MHKLEALRQDINKMIAADSYDENELLKLSQKLDKYIVEAMKESNCINMKPGKDEKKSVTAW